MTNDANQAQGAGPPPEAPISLCQLCGEPANAELGPLKDHPELGPLHVACFHAERRARRKAKACEQRELHLAGELDSLRSELEKARAERSQAKAADSVAEPSSPCAAAMARLERCEENFVKGEEFLEKAEREWDKAKADAEECRRKERERHELMAQRFAARRGEARIEYRSRSRLSVALPSLGGGAGITLIVLLLLGFFAERPEPKPRVERVEVPVERERVVTLRPRMELDATGTESYRALRAVVDAYASRFDEAELAELEAALEADRKSVVVEMGDDGRPKVVEVRSKGRRQP